MGFLTSLFGGAENPIVTVVLALAVVLVLIVLGVWILKMIFQATGNVARGRNKRLAVIDSMAIDPKRQLVLLRRDNVEHLVLVGGNADLVVETDITPPSVADTLKRQRSTNTALKNLSPANQPTTEPETAPKRTKSLRHTGLLRPASRQEPDLNPQPLGEEPRFDEANASDSDKSAAWAVEEAGVPPVSHDENMDGGSAFERQSGKKKRRG